MCWVCGDLPQISPLLWLLLSFPLFYQHFLNIHTPLMVNDCKFTGTQSNVTSWKKQKTD